MKSWIIAIASLVGLGFGVADSAARCLSYAPAKATLVGTLTSRAVPGPPNYYSITRGDHPETIFILTLDEPICVSGDPSSRSNSKGHSRVAEVQLVTRGADPKRFRNARVRASGSLSSARTRNHRPPVVLTVVNLRAVQRDPAAAADRSDSR